MEEKFKLGQMLRHIGTGFKGEVKNIQTKSEWKEPKYEIFIMEGLIGFGFESEFRDLAESHGCTCGGKHTGEELCINPRIPSFKDDLCLCCGRRFRWKHN